MDHIAIMKPSWNLIANVIDGTKTVESRWYKSKRCPWDRVKIGDILYFKDVGKPVSIKSRVTRVEQYEVRDNENAIKIMNKYSLADLGTSILPKEVEDYITNKKYAVFVHFNNVELVSPFAIDKKGYGMQCAWITTENVNDLII
ncbi:hypothetical protein COT69_00630 [candidate division WWE3 bacterium CG09_land_8_20_14_0_10_39_24]|uniref:ASCH domain-containing protein n=1 Tax=candidate division WWE3 bacterium CG09_land_8_20_14_0_10_39_24 TaxID=1975088 RepID=A0A2H0WKC4_UNCKA|nr:MAG: hypothetical protein COT69_00630 [candidate division WWE3 bacterium CG09_land_8_20_14_0_10_39_24]PJE50857.1 MAG: hypothetical protein COV27_02475 [candidate division WWE3 bacterium CG10_big_fil_rev_8_21_14_0_10_39_14]